MSKQYRSRVFDSTIPGWTWTGWQNLDGDVDSVPFPSEFRQMPTLKKVILKTDDGTMTIVRGNDLAKLFKTLDEWLGNSVSFSVDFEFE